MVNLRTIGGKIRHEKVALKCIGLVFWVLTGETSLKGKSEEKKGSKKEACRGDNFSSPCPSFSSDSHAISSPFQVFIMSMKCPRSNPK